MALDAQVIGGFKGHHFGFVSGPTGLVTAQALGGQVFVSRVWNFFADRMCGMGLPFVTFTAKANADRRLCLCDQQNIIRGMGIMTGDAVACFYRFAQPLVFGILDRPLLEFDRVRMAFSAGVGNRSFQELFLL